MGNNGKSSSIKRTKNVNIRFFVTDRLHKGGMPVKWSPIGEITGGLLTKPSGESIFKRFRDLIIVLIQLNRIKQRKKWQQKEK